MDRLDKELIRGTMKMAGYILLLFAACKATSGLAVIVLVMYALYCSLSTEKLGTALACYVLFPLLAVANPMLCPIGGVASIAMRLGFMAMTFTMMIAAGKRSGNEQVPLATLWLYLFSAVFSSLDGYAPLISYMKLVNFGFFFVGIWLGLRNIDKRPKALMFFRQFLLAIAVLVIFGSLFLAVFFPGYAYFNSLRDMIRTVGVEEANAILTQGGGGGGLLLLCGVTNQSQCLAPLSVMTAAWVVCDMIFVERRVSKLHSALLICAAPLIFMTRSRGALFAGCVGGFMIYSYCFKRLNVNAKVRKKLKSGVTTAVMLIALIATFYEIKDNSITRWIRKTDDVEGDSRSLSEAVTESRMGLIAENLRDFNRNPLFGSGFQVAEEFQYLYPRDKLVLSAPIEKGVLPVMVLGEGGVVGGACFLIFLCTFYAVCNRKHYAVTSTLFSVLMATNMAEATFFSTGGAGGILWVMAIIGGFTIDMIVKHRRVYERGMGGQRFGPMQFAPQMMPMGPRPMPYGR